MSHAHLPRARSRTTRRVLGATAAAVTFGTIGPSAWAAVSPPDSGVTKIVSVSNTGATGDKTSTRARISQDGRFVTFQSAALNLTSQRGGGTHVYFTDLSGVLIPGGNHTTTVDLDATTGGRCKTDLGMNGHSTISEVSDRVAGDGPWVVFASDCFNLVPGWAHVGDVYIKNMATGNVQVVSKANGSETQPIAPVSVRPVISDDGRYVAWNSTAGDVFVRDMRDTTVNRTVRVVASTASNDESLRPEISGDGSHLIFASDARLAAGDTNLSRNVYLVDLRAWQANKANKTFKPVLVDVTPTGQAAPSTSSRPGINRDGTIVTFQSFSGLVADDTNGVLDAYWRNMVSGQTVLLSRGWGGEVPNGQSTRPQLDDSGYVAAFTSTSNALVKGDTNGRPDAFIRKLNRTNPAQGTTYVISQRPDGNIAGGVGSCPAQAAGTTSPGGGLVAQARAGNANIATRPYLSGDAGRVVFVSGMCDLVQPGTDGTVNQIYVRTYGPGGP
ncbi:MAG TPA: hypothetical protein VFJ97_03265 [Dermatophilaceae bacterium]|nr:hypothetical protein [Dermatophilaceae bacterium]